MKTFDLELNSTDLGINAPLKNTTIYKSTDGYLTASIIPPFVPSPPRPRQRIETHTYDFHHNKMIFQESSQWTFTEEEILSAPCIQDGLDPVEERCRRAKGVNFITQAGILLKLPQLTIATASIFFHRYFMRQSMLPEKGGAHHYNIAATALFLATKTEENCRKTREIVVAVAKVAQKNPSLIIDEQSKEYWKWRDSILVLEEHMLELLTFDLVVNTPHMNLLRCLEALSIEENKQIRNTAWAFLNDSCMTPLCLMMPASDITVAAIYFAVKLNNETLPDIGKKPWWHCINGDPEKIVKAVSVVDRFWTENPLRKNDHPYGSSPSSPDDLERTRRRGSDNISSTGDFSDNFETQHTPKVPESSKSCHTPDDPTNHVNTAPCPMEKTTNSGKEGSSKPQNTDDKNLFQALEAENIKPNTLSNQIDDHAEAEVDTEIEEGEASDKCDEPNPSQAKENITPEAHEVNSIPTITPSKRRLSEEEVNKPEGKRIRTDDLAEEG